MESLGLNGLVAAKKLPENLLIPVDVVNALRPMAAKMGARRKWMVYTAAMLAFLRKGEGEQMDLIGEVAAADATGGFADLLNPLAESRVIQPPRITHIQGGKVIHPKDRKG